jgi:hypothetical protein
MKRIALLLLLILAPAIVLADDLPAWTGPFSTDKASAYTCVRAEKPIVLDGRLDDAAWAQAQVIEGLVVPPKVDWAQFGMTRPRAATSQSHVRLMWDDRYLYLGAELEDRDLYASTPPGHDSSFGTDDLIELFLKPADDKPWYWELHLAPSGGTRDYFYARRGAGGEGRWKIYDSGMEAKVSLVGTFDDWDDRDTKWTSEIRIPWSAFDRWGGKPAPGDMWRFLLSRYDYSVHLEDGREISAAAPLPWGDFHAHEYYPYLTFAGR